MLRGEKMKEIFCENDFCIYYKKGKCTSNEINLYGAAACTEATNVSFEKNLLNFLKDKALNDLNTK